MNTFTEKEETGLAVDMLLADFTKEYIDDTDSAEELKKYLNFAYNNSDNELHMPANILIKADSADRAFGFLKKLSKLEQILTGKENTLQITSESALHRGLFEKRTDKLKGYKEKREGIYTVEMSEKNPGLICALKNFESPDRDADKRGHRAAELREAWKTFCKREMFRDDIRFAVCTDYDTAKEKFANCPDEELKILLDSFYNFKVTLKKRTAGDIADELISRFKENGFTLKEAFKNGLKKYVANGYPESGTDPDAFIARTYSLIMKNIYGCPKPVKLISADKLPKIKEKTSFEEVSEKLGKLTGLSNVKKTLKELESYCLLDRKNAKDMSLHFVFSGNAGTGKTTIAHLMAELLCSLGVIKENKVVEVSADELMGMYIGDATRLVKEKCTSAYGGILFIDEAYSINPANAERNLKTYRQEGLSELLKEMENNRDKLTVIFAGYKNEMDDFMNGNPGLKSRIFRRIEFEDYSEDELLEIFKGYCEENGCKCSKETLSRAKAKLHILKYDENFGNARTVRNMFHDAQLALIESKGPECNELEPEHIVIENTLPDYEESNRKLMAMTGLDNVKKTIGDIASLCRYNSFTGKKAFPAVSNMLFTGNPGTGKTTVAELFGNMLFALGAVSAPRFVSINAYELNSSKVAGVSEKLKECCRKAMGGVLFIDEAYALGDFGSIGESDAISVLLDFMENERDNLVIILAGYKDEMEDFLKRNPGLRSRIPTHIHFEDYSPDELEEIFVGLAKENGFSITDGALQVFRECVEKELLKEDFANARFVRNIFKKVFTHHAVSCVEQGCIEEDNIIDACDMPDEDEWEQEHVQIGFV